MRLIFICFFVLIYSLQCVNAQKETGFKYEISGIVDNDALLFGQASDRYYSFGMGLDIAFKKQQFLGLQKLFSKKQNYFFAIQIKSEGHTPSYQIIDHSNLANNQFDRPFAGVLYGQLNGVYTFKNVVFRSGVLLGVMGPASFAKDIQWWYHTKVADEIIFEGWAYQVPNQIIYNLSVDVVRETMLIDGWFSSFGALEARIGNLYTDFSPTIGIRLGKLDEFTKSISVGNGVLSSKKRMHLYAQSEIKTTLTFFNGTAQGNLFAGDYPYKVNDLSTTHLTLVQSVYGAYKGVTVGFSYYFTQDRVLYFAQHHYGRMLVRYAW